MRRQVFEQVGAAGFDLRSVEACAVAQGARGRRRLYAGTADGALTTYECRADTSEAIRSGAYELVPGEALRKFSSREKKAVTQIEVVEGQNLLFALVDGVVVAYDTVASRATAHVRDARGSVLFASHPPSRTLVILHKRKARVFQWQRGGALRDKNREYDVPDTPTAAVCLSETCCVVAFRKEFAILRLDGAAAAADALPAAPPGKAGFRDKFGDTFGTLTNRGGGGGATASAETTTRRLVEAPNGTGVVLIVIPGSQATPQRERLLASTAHRGLLFDVGTVTGIAASSLKYNNAPRELEDRVTWGSAPLACRRVSAFVVALTGASGTTTVEVHFAPTLARVQTFDLSGFQKVDRPKLCGGDPPSAGVMLGASMSGTRKKTSHSDDAVPSGPDELFAVGEAKASVLRMVPVDQQVEALVEAAQYQDALSLCAIAAPPPSSSVGGDGKPRVDVAAIEERYAYALYARGDFEGAVGHWLNAATSPEDVVQLYGALKPQGLDLEAAKDDDAARPMSPEKRVALRNPAQLRGASLSRAAAALALFLEAWRDRQNGIIMMPSSSSSSSSSKGGRASLFSPPTRLRRSPGTAEPSKDHHHHHHQQQPVVPVSEALRTVVDTMLVAARLACAPPRLGAVVGLFKEPTHACALESLAPLLAAGGAESAEALLWLYRSRGAHERALALLVEDRCCGGPGGWDRARFRRWKARYVRALWFDGDARHAHLALDAAESLFRMAPALALTALCGGKIHHPPDDDDDAFDVDVDVDAAALAHVQDDHAASSQHRRLDGGGAGMPAQDVVNWMKKLDLSKLGSESSRDRTHDDADEADEATVFVAASNKDDDDDDENGTSFPLLSGTAVAIAYLEFVVARGEQLAVLHNELAYLLLEGLNKAAEPRRGTGSSAAAVIYRAKLRHLLKTSTRYHAAHMLASLPADFVLEKALVLARLGRHADVLDVYANEVRDDALAEAYCAEVWDRGNRRRLEALVERNRRMRAGDVVDDDEEDEEEASANVGTDVYLILAKRYYDGGRGSEGEAAALALLSRNLDKFDPVRCLNEVLPKDAACANAVADFVAKLIRFWQSEKRALDIEHQLLRVDFVNVKYKLTQHQLKQQSKMSAVPELARLGRVKRSLPPVVLSDAEDLRAADPYHVACTRHIFDAHVVLQFHVTNNAPAQRLQNVRVRVESLGDADLYAHDAEVPLKALPYASTGSCYVVFRTYPTVGVVTTSFACELRFSVLSDVDGAGSFYLEEIVLRDLELSTADM